MIVLLWGNTPHPSPKQMRRWVTGTIWDGGSPPLCLFLTLGEYNPEKLYIVAVGCKHTGYKALMAGLVTEWIYDAFAGKLSYLCINLVC